MSSGTTARSLRRRVGDLFVHGDAAQADAELERLDHTAEETSWPIHRQWAFSVGKDWTGCRFVTPKAAAKKR
jgi:hypothetical protein